MKINHLAFGIFVPPWLRKNMHTHAHTYEHTYIHYSLPFPNLFICPNLFLLHFSPGYVGHPHLPGQTRSGWGTGETLYSHLRSPVIFKQT